VGLKQFVTTVIHVAYDLALKLNPRKLAGSAVITDEAGRVLLLRSRYVGDQWALPGGGLDRRENLDGAVVRECREELGCEVELEAMTGFYYYAGISAYVGAFRARIVSGQIRLSHEHSEYRWVPVADLPGLLRTVVEDALGYQGKVAVRTFR